MGDLHLPDNTIINGLMAAIKFFLPTTTRYRPSDERWMFGFEDSFLSGYKNIRLAWVRNKVTSVFDVEIGQYAHQVSRLLQLRI